MADRRRLEKLFAKHNCNDFKWMDPKEIVVSQWVRMKCQFGCEDYATRVMCPPNAPPVSECERFFSEFKEAVLIHFERTFENPEDRYDWVRHINNDLFELERAVFFSGHHKAFVIYIGPCSICKECTPEHTDCKHPRKARPSPEGLAVDVFSTARKHGYDIRVLTDYDQRMNRFGILLIE
jgi:predicted metal-binding protein